MGDLSDFQKEQIMAAPFTRSICNLLNSPMVLVFWEQQSLQFWLRAQSLARIHQRRRIVGETWKWMIGTLNTKEDCVNTKVLQQKWQQTSFTWKIQFPQKLTTKNFTKPTPMKELQLITFESLKLMPKSEKDGVTIIKPGRLARQITWLEFPPPTSLKQLADVLIDNIQLKTIQQLYESLIRRLEIVLKANGGKTHLNKEILLVSQVFTLFCPTPVYSRIVKVH